MHRDFAQYPHWLLTRGKDQLPSRADSTHGTADLLRNVHFTGFRFFVFFICTTNSNDDSAAHGAN